MISKLPNAEIYQSKMLLLTAVLTYIESGLFADMALLVYQQLRKLIAPRGMIYEFAEMRRRPFIQRQHL